MYVRVGGQSLAADLHVGVPPTSELVWGGWHLPRGGSGRLRSPRHEYWRALASSRSSVHQEARVGVGGTHKQRGFMALVSVLLVVPKRPEHYSPEWTRRGERTPPWILRT